MLVASVSPMRTASLKAGMTTEIAGSMNGSSPKRLACDYAIRKLLARATSFVNFDYELPVLADMASIHPAGIKWQCHISIFVHRNETAGTAKLFGVSQSALGRFGQSHSTQFHQRRNLMRHSCANE